MNTNQDTTKYNTLSGRLLSYFPLKLLLGIMILSIGLMSFLYYLSGSAFFIVAIFLFIVTTFSNFFFFKKRARFFISSYTTDNENITIHYFDKNERLHITAKWTEFDYYFGSIKGDNYLVIWHKNQEIMKLYKSVGNHKMTFNNLNSDYHKYISPERITKYSALNFMNPFEVSYTKRYSGAFKIA